MRKAGFTLIELLIVVAIIAILAAIAVPNFLEAQTRSKVSAAHSELRTKSVALNAYKVDSHRYPEQSDIVDPAARRRGLEVLTTPVAYLTEISADPFSRFDMFNMNPYYVNISDNPSITAHAREVNKYILGSVGPDGEDDLLNVLRDLVEERKFMVFESGVYDPTNGTISAGDLVRTNCSVLGGG